MDLLPSQLSQAVEDYGNWNDLEIETMEKVHKYIVFDLQCILLIPSKYSILPEDGAITPENVDLCFSQQESRKAEHTMSF